MIEHIKIDWYRTPIAREKLRELTARSDWKPLLHVLAQLALSAATGFVAFYSFRNWAWPVTVLLVWVHCTFYNFLGYAGGAHELSHRNVFKTSWLNEVVMFVSGVLSWGNYIHFRHSHMKHHQLTVHSDHDYEVILPNIVPARQWFWILIFLVTLGSFTAKWLNVLAGYPQHLGMEPDVPDLRLSCRSFIPHPFIRFLYGNMNYHVEHHMYASVPFYNIPKLNREIAWDIPVATRGLFRLWREEVLPIIRRQRTDPDWIPPVELPEGSHPPLRYGEAAATR